MPGEVIIPDETMQGQEQKKINLKNLFTFLSSLDYIKAIETSDAFENIDSKQFYFTGEKQSLLLFVYTHTSFWIFLIYIVLLISIKLILEIPTIYAVLGISVIWTLFGFWFVNRYTWGSGYLWEVARDFMVNITIASFVISLTIDFLLLFVAPALFDLIVKWLNSGPKEGYLNTLLESFFIWIKGTFRPIIEKFRLGVENILPAYLAIGATKFFAFLVPTIYMFYIHKKRKDLKENLNERLKKLA